VTLLWLCSCGVEPEPAWLLTEEPRWLAARVEVIEPGPLSDDLLPIPADRVRSQGLPGDTVEISAWAFLGGETDAAAADPAWFMCPRTGGCTGRLEFSSEPCAESVPQRVACRLPDGERTRFVIPALDADLPLDEQASIGVVFVGHADASMTTEECIERISDPSLSNWGPCIVGLRSLTLGPVARVVEHAADLGIELPEDITLGLRRQLVVPPYNPEVIPIPLSPYHGDRQFDESRTIMAVPGEVTVLEPGVVYRSSRFWDPKDIQNVVVYDGRLLSLEASAPWRRLATTTPGVVERVENEGWQIWAPEEPTEFSVHFTLGDLAGGAAWGTYFFEVRSP
jgi:hypothetical protein